MAKKICPLIKGECLEHGCEFYVHLVGQHPQTGKDMDVWDCSFKWFPMIAAQTTQKIIGVSAAIEDFRNRAVSALTTVGDAMMRRLEQHDEKPSLPHPGDGCGGSGQRPQP